MAYTDTCTSEEQSCADGACQELLASMAALNHAECHHHNGAANQLYCTCADNRPGIKGRVTMMRCITDKHGDGATSTLSCDADAYNLPMLMTKERRTCRPGH